MWRRSMSFCMKFGQSGKIFGTSWGNFRVILSYLNGGVKVLGGLLNCFLLYSSMLRRFWRGLTIEVWDFMSYLLAWKV